MGTKNIKKIITAMVAVILIIGISFGTAFILHRRWAVPAAVTVENGLSAYELAVQNGYTGDVQEWLSSLSGKSAYEIAADAGYEGSEAEWTANLNELVQSDVVGIKTASFNNEGKLVITLSDDTTLNLGNAIGADGKDGMDGKDGVDGKDGKDGKDGVDGMNGSSGRDGKDGISITDVSINDADEFIIAFSDNRSVNLGKIVSTTGEQGPQGEKGDTGEDGITPQIRINASTNMWEISTDEGVSWTSTNVPATGEQGLQGEKGDTGEDGITPQIRINASTNIGQS